MSDKPTTRNNEEQRAARLTAFVLDELSSDERAEVEAELASVPGKRRVYEELTQIAEELQAGKWDDASSERSPALRAAVSERLSEFDPTVELPTSRTTFSRRRWVAVITISTALLVLAIPLQWVQVPERVANDFRDLLPSRAPAAPDDVDVANVMARPSRHEQIVLTKPEAETLNGLKYVPIESLKAGEASAELVRQSQEQVDKNVVTYGEGLPQEKTNYRDLPENLLHQLTELNVANEELRANKSEAKQLEEALKRAQQEGQVQIRTIAAENGYSIQRVQIQRVQEVADKLSQMKSGVVVMEDGASIVPAAPAESPTATRVAGRATSSQVATGPNYPQVPLGWRNTKMTWDDGWWQLDFKSPDSNGNGIPPAEGVQPHFYYEARAEAELGEAEGESKHLGRSLAKQSAVKALQIVPRNEQYAPIVENQFVGVVNKPVSTFSIDVDTASYANVRRFLTQGQLPPPNAVRLEELINYFGYEYPEPEGKDPFSVSMEVAQCPWQPVHQIVRIGLKGKEVPRKERPASSLVFLLDVSGSMQDENKLPLLKKAMKLLTDQLTENDRVTIVTYAGNAGLALETTNGESKETIRGAIDGLNANGSTNGSAGIQLAYEKATEAFVKEGTNRVILATDGDLNVGVTEDGDLVKLITEKAKSGVFLTVLGFGEGNLKDGKLEKLADNGNGMYAYIDSFGEARKVLVEQISGSLVTIAKDVKIKVEFNPAEVAAYRLLGYENRLMTAAEFNDDTKDAGEIGAGHTVTALYEVVPRTANPKLTASDGELKYQRLPTPVEPPKELTDAAKTGDLLTLYLRYKQPDEDESTLRESVVKNEKRAFDEASADFRFAASVASFGMHLRNSKYRGSTSFAVIEETAASAVGDDPQGHRAQFVDLVRRASELVSRQGK